MLCMLPTKSAPRRPLSTQPSAPAASTCGNRSFGSFWLITRIFTVGESFRSKRAASNPFIPGMLTSRRIKSGDNSRAFSIASVPFVASPQICQSVCGDNKRMTPRRTASLSSAIRIRKAVMSGCGSYPPARVGSFISSSARPVVFGTGKVTIIFVPCPSDVIVMTPCR